MNNEVMNIWTIGALSARGLVKPENIEDLYTLVKIGRKLNRFYTHSCNGYNMEKYDRLAEKWEGKAETIAKRLGCHIYFQTDPRGATIYIDTKAIPRNNYTTAVCMV